MATNRLLRTSTGSWRHDQRGVAAVDETLLTRTIAERPAVVADVPAWGVGETYGEGAVVRDVDQLYRLIDGKAPHTAHDPAWRPSAVASVWVRTWAEDVIPVWFQPSMAEDAWLPGAEVWYPAENTGLWRNALTIPNVWVPGVTGWTQINDWSDQPTDDGEIAQWVSGEVIVFDPGADIDDRPTRMYEGAIYRLINHPGVNIWPPPTAASIWEAL